MSRTDRERLEDILEATTQIVALTGRGRSAFDTDLAIQPALERLLEVIGGSATRLSSEAMEALPDVDWSRIRRLRIVLAHHYHRVDPEQVWTIATSAVPSLLTQVQKRLSEESG